MCLNSLFLIAIITITPFHKILLTKINPRKSKLDFRGFHGRGEPD